MSGPGGSGHLIWYYQQTQQLGPNDRILMEQGGPTTPYTYTTPAQILGSGFNTGWGAATGGSQAAFDASTATLAQTAAAVAEVIANLTTHGLIGT